MLASALRVRPGEGRLVGLMFAYQMAVVSAFIVGRTVRDTLFLARVDLDTLPLMYVVVAGAVAFSSFVYSKIADRMRREHLISASLGAFAAVYVAIWLALKSGQAGSWVYPLLYVAVEIIGALSIIQFWTFANDLFHARQAKRLFGLIGAGGVISNIVCGFSIGAIVHIVGPESLVVVCGALLVGAILLVTRVEKPADLESATRPKRRSDLDLKRDSGRVFQSRHLKVIAALVAITFFTVSIVDFQFKVVAKQTFTGEGELAGFFGYFYGFTGIAASLMQFFVTGRILERAGVAPALMILPGVVLLGVTGLFFLPAAIIALTIAKGAEVIFRYTINDATVNLLYVPVPARVRSRAKAFIDGILKPASIGLAGLLMWTLGRFSAPEDLANQLAVVDVALLLAWLGLVLGIRKEYLRSLIDTLKARRLDPDQAWAPVVDDATKEALKENLNSGDDTRVLHALELVPAMQVELTSDLERLLDHNSRDVRVRALELVGGSGSLSSADAISGLLADPEPELRAAAARAFMAVAGERGIRNVAPFLGDDNIEVRAGATAALVKHGGLDGILTAAETLKGLLESEDPACRRAGARVLTEIRVQSFFSPVLKLLSDEDRSVRLAALEAAGEMKSPELVPSLVYRLSDPYLGPAAVRALANYGPEIERTLFKVLRRRRESIAVRRRIPKVLGRIGTPASLPLLLEQLSAEDPELREQVARAAARIRERYPTSPLSADGIVQAVRNEVQAAYQTLTIIHDLQLPEDHLLQEALRFRQRKHISIAFRFLEVRYPARTIQLVASNLDSDNRVVRANALEVVDNLLAREESRLFIPLLEDQPDEDRVRFGAEQFELIRCEPNEWLETLVADSDPWLRTCSMMRVRELGLDGLASQVESHVAAPEAMVRETALLTLASFAEANPALAADQSERWNALAKGSADDEEDLVRHASSVLSGHIVLTAV